MSSTRLRTGAFVVIWQQSEGHLQIIHHTTESNVLWENTPGTAFVYAAVGAAKVSESRGFFRVTEKKQAVSTCQSIDSIHAHESSVTLSGLLDNDSELPWSLILTGVDEHQVRFELTGPVQRNRVELQFFSKQKHL